jgi:hypothetical protein
MLNLTSSRKIFKPSAEPPSFWWAGWWRYGEEVGKWTRRGRQGVVPQFRFDGCRAWVRTCTGAVVTFRNIKEPAEPESPSDDRAPSSCRVNARSLIRLRPRSTAGPPKRKRRPCQRASRSAARAACRFLSTTTPTIDRNGLPGKRVVKRAGLPPRGLSKIYRFSALKAAARIRFLPVTTRQGGPLALLSRLFPRG